MNHLGSFKNSDNESTSLGWGGAGILQFQQAPRKCQGCSSLTTHTRVARPSGTQPNIWHKSSSLHPCLGEEGEGGSPEKQRHCPGSCRKQEHNKVLQHPSPIHPPELLPSMEKHLPTGERVWELGQQKREGQEAAHPPQLNSAYHSTTWQSSTKPCSCWRPHQLAR